jgi:ASTRA-associated protein 1
MAMAVTRDNTLALSVSADHLVGRYDLTVLCFPFRNRLLGLSLLLQSRSTPLKQGLQPIELSTPAMLLSQSVTTVKYARSEDGMGGMFADVVLHNSFDLRSSLPRVRLYSTKTMKALGVLQYHKDGCSATAFAKSLDCTDGDDDSDDDDEMTGEEKMARCRWLAAGGKDCRVSLWALMSFGKT